LLDRSETVFNYKFGEFGQEWQMGDWPIAGQIFFVKIIFFRRGMPEQALN